MVRLVKREILSGKTRSNRSGSGQNDTAQGSTESENQGNIVQRRVLRSKYLNVKSRICDERDEISKVDSDKFKSIIDEVDGLHQLVQKPREQVADAEALFDIASTLVSSVKSYNSEGLTPADFVSCLLRDYGQRGQGSSSQEVYSNLIRWKDLGNAVSHVFRCAPGCCTMVGPMNTELKQRKNVVRRKHTKPTDNSQPEKLDGTVEKEKTDTDMNMAVMFDILVKHRKVNLENLILNRGSFAQTVENLFALSFLIKDGRAQLLVEDGFHLVKPKNAPSAEALASGEASFSHFIFRFDFSDWKLMLSSVGAGEELMPHRGEGRGVRNPPENSVSEEPHATSLPTTPIRKLCRNRGFVMQQQEQIVEDSPESVETTAAARTGAIRRGKRKLR